MSIVKQKIIKETEEISDIFCDACDKSCRLVIGGFEYMTLDAYWGYFSRHDGKVWKAHICQDCAETKLNFIKFEKMDAF